MAEADCARVAEIRVRGWQTAYAGLIPRTYLDAMSVPEETNRRRVYLSEADVNVVNLVAERDGEVLGWSCHGPYRGEDTQLVPTAAELYAVYVHPAHVGKGVGHALLTESTARCTTAGYRRLRLWVLDANSRARRFYEREGFRADGAEESFEVAGVDVPEVRYGRGLDG